MKRRCLLAFILGILGELLDTLSVGWLITLKRPVIRWIVSWPAPNFAAWLNLYSLYMVQLLMVLAAVVVIRWWVKAHQIEIYMSFAIGLHMQSWFWSGFFIASGSGFNWTIQLQSFSYNLVVIGLGLVALQALRRKGIARGFEPIVDSDSVEAVALEKVDQFEHS